MMEITFAHALILFAQALAFGLALASRVDREERARVEQERQRLARETRNAREAERRELMSRIAWEDWHREREAERQGRANARREVERSLELMLGRRALDAPRVALAVAARGEPERCAYCHDALDGCVERCRCGVAVHAECRGEHGRCVTLGCKEVGA